MVHNPILQLYVIRSVWIGISCAFNYANEYVWPLTRVINSAVPGRWNLGLAQPDRRTKRSRRVTTAKAGTSDLPIPAVMPYSDVWEFEIGLTDDRRRSAQSCATADVAATQ